MFDFIKKFFKPDKASPIQKTIELPKPLPVKRDPVELRFEYYKAKLRNKRNIRNRIARKSRKINYQRGDV